MHSKDVKMAGAYGGEAQPRVRMIPKRFPSNARNERSGQVFRDSSILSPSQMLAPQDSSLAARNQPKIHADSAVDMRTRT